MNHVWDVFNTQPKFKGGTLLVKVAETPRQSRLYCVYMMRTNPLKLF